MQLPRSNTDSDESDEDTVSTIHRIRYGVYKYKGRITSVPAGTVFRCEAKIRSPFCRGLGLPQLCSKGSRIPKPSTASDSPSHEASTDHDYLPMSDTDPRATQIPHCHMSFLCHYGRLPVVVEGAGVASPDVHGRLCPHFERRGWEHEESSIVEPKGHVTMAETALVFARTCRRFTAQ